MALDVILVVLSVIWLVAFAYMYEKAADAVGTFRYWMFVIVGASLLFASCLSISRAEAVPCYLESVRDAGADG